MQTAINAVSTAVTAAAGFMGAIAGAAIVGLINWKTTHLRLRQDLRLAAIDKRLVAHQQAFALWHKLFFAIHDKDHIGEIALECQTWWISNCLYLTPKSRNAFRTSYTLAHWFHQIPFEKDSEHIRKENYGKIQAAGSIIASEVGLSGVEER